MKITMYYPKVTLTDGVFVATAGENTLHVHREAASTRHYRVISRSTRRGVGRTHLNRTKAEALREVMKSCVFLGETVDYGEAYCVAQAWAARAEELVGSRIGRPLSEAKKETVPGWETLSFEERMGAVESEVLV